MFCLFIQFSFSFEQDKITQANSVLYNLCKVVTSIGLIGLVFGQSYSRTVLTLYGGAKFVGGDGLSVLLLRWHAFAIVLLAVNGIWEGYMFATMTSKEINKFVKSVIGFHFDFTIHLMVLRFQIQLLHGIFLHNISGAIVSVDEFLRAGRIHPGQLHQYAASHRLQWGFHSKTISTSTNASIGGNHTKEAVRHFSHLAWNPV